MTNSFRKDVLVMLIISVALTSFSSIFLALHGFYPFNGKIFVKSNLYSAIYLFTFALLHIYAIIRLGKYNASRLCKAIGIYTFIFLPLLLIVSIYFGILVVHDGTSWNYWLVTVFLGVNILYQLGMSLYISNRLIKENKGYVAIKNISWMIIGFSSAIFLFYTVSPIKTLFVDLSASVMSKAIKTGYYVFSGIEILVMFAISFWIFYVGYSTFLSGLTNDLVDIRHNVNFTRRVYQKYHVSFYFSVVSLSIMLVVAIVASFTFLVHYLSLVALYASLLLIKVPVHYYDLHIDKKYEDEETIFKKKHAALIYSGIIFLIYAVIVVFFGSSSQGKNLENRNLLTIFIIFVPYALARLAIAVSKYVKYRQSYNPVFLTSFYADIVLAMFTITNVVIMFGFTLKNAGFILAALVLAITLIIFCVVVAIYLIVVGICGLKNKRVKSYQKYLETSKAIKDVLEDD